MMTITTLSENLTYYAGLVAEHGLSVLIEINGRKVLFDTGQGNALVHNTDQLRIDLREINDLVISHGHYDHVGGMEDFLNVNRKTKVYIKEEAFANKMRDTSRQIGIKNSPRKNTERFCFIDKVLEIEEGVFVMPEIPIQNPADTGFSGFITDTGNGVKPDEFDDELYLAIVIHGKLSVISGCSHRGISNILMASTSHFNMPVKLVLGGFHLMDCSENQYRTVVDAFKKVDPEFIGVCHCTGMDTFCKLRSDLGERVFYNYCGSRIEIE